MHTFLSLISQSRLAVDLGALSNWWTLAFSSIIQLALFVRWLYRRIRNDEITRAFVHDMATNHLPHIYERLEKICDQQGIERSPLPPIRWLDLNGKSRG